MLPFNNNASFLKQNLKTILVISNFSDSKVSDQTTLAILFLPILQ